MTLDTAHSKEIYQGNGNTTEFPFFFKVWDAAQIAVTVTDAAGSSVDVTTQCAIALNDGGGSVGYLHAGAPLPVGATLAITRNMPFTQGVDLVSGSQFDPQVIEDALDQATAERQQVKEMLGRAVILPSTSDDTPQEVVQDIYTARDDAEAAAAAAAASENAAAASATQSAAQALLAEQSRGQACQCADRAEQARDVAMQQAETINVVMATEMGKINTAIAINKDDQAAAITASRAWSETDEDVPVDTDEQGNPEYSSKHWALKSSQLLAGNASKTGKGVMQVGSGLDVDEGVVSASVATTTSRGIARVATLADMEPGAIIENGPAAIDAKGGVITPTPTAHAVPQADADGKLDGWVSLASKANTDLSNVDLTKTNVVLQQVRYVTGEVATGSAGIPNDDSIPQITEGTQFLAVNITPKSATSKLVINVTVVYSIPTTSHTHVALFDGNNDAIAVAAHVSGINYTTTVSMQAIVPSTGTSALTFSVRMGNDSSSTITLNGLGGSRKMGGKSASSIIVTEYAV